MKIAPLLALSCIAAGLLGQSPQTVGTWSAISTAASPPLRVRAQMVYDPVRNVMFLTGGLPPVGTFELSDVWEFNGTNWVQRFPANPLNFHARPARHAFSTTRGKIIALDGDFGGAPMALHEWTGTNYVNISSNAPIGRADYFDVAWDSTRNVLVMFGGGIAFADTWEWDGTTWTQRSTGGPPGRHDHRMLYDTARQTVVLYGGISYQGSVVYTDTWEWDGSVWRERFGIPSAGVRPRFDVTWDSTRQRAVLFGGSLASNGSDTGRVSLYDGSAWNVLTTLGGPTSMDGAAIAYDSLRNRTLSFGGFANGTAAGFSALDIRTGILGTFGPHGVGCPGPNGVATVGTANNTRPVLGSTLQLRFGNLPSSPLALVFATLGFSDQTWNGQTLPFSLTSIGMPGCALLMAPGTTEVLSNSGGVANWSFAIPASTALDGLRFYVQGGVLTPGFNAAGVVMSDSGQGVAGAI